jgi:hypothetical protein
MSDSEQHHYHYYYPYYYPQPPPRGPGVNGFAVAALVLGIVGVCCCLGLLGLVFGMIAKKQIEVTGQSGEGMATAGVVLGCISIVPTVMWLMSLFGG